MTLQGLGLADPIDTDDISEGARAAGFDAGQGILEDRGLAWQDVKQARSGQVRVRRRLARQVLLRGHDAIDARLKELVDSSGDQYVMAVGA